MNTFALRPSVPPGSLARFSPRRIAAELWVRERRLALYGALMLALALAMAVAAGIDERVLRGANVWVKPMKFALSTAVLAFTTAWFVGHLRPAPGDIRAVNRAVNRALNRAVSRIVWLLIGAGSFEVGYIALQAALGEASHYNVGDAFHGAMYTLMGLGALALTATQPMLAWQLRRHPDPERPVALRLAVVLGLWLTFAFGAGVGMLLANLQPPDVVPGTHVPLLGWALRGGDLRPAHFIGIHAEQVLPLAGAAIAALGLRGAQRWVWVVAVAYAVLFAAAVAWGLVGRV